MDQAPTLILASSSPYRQTLLRRLGMPFQTISPDIDESAQADESCLALVKRLSAAKSRKVAQSAPEATVIGSDQVTILNSKQLSKPGSYATAAEQLQEMRKQVVHFHTGLCVLHGPSGLVQQDIVSYSIAFRDYTEEEIERYLRLEEPYNCAGSFKSEGLGISLVEKMQGPDPTALIGLPLLRLSEMLRHLDYKIP